MTYSIDFRKKVLSIKASEGLSFAETAKRFRIGKNSVFLWTKRLMPKTTRDKASTKIDLDRLKADVESNPDSYQYERAERFNVSKSGIWHALRRLNLSYKKNFKSSKSLP